MLDQILLGATFSQTQPVWELLAWGAFAIIPANEYRLPLLRVVGLVSLAAFAGALIVSRSGGYGPDFLERPEGLLPAGALILVLRLIVTRLNDGTGEPNGYHVWRRAQDSLAPFTTIGDTTSPSFLDTTSGSGDWEYEITL